MIYRMVIDNGDGTFSTGANYEGCSIDNKDACDPKYFYSIDEVLAYASERGEAPVWVENEEEAWRIVAGEIVVDDEIVSPEQVTIAGFDNKTMVIVGLVIAGLLIRRLRP